MFYEPIREGEAVFRQRLDAALSSRTGMRIRHLEAGEYGMADDAGRG